MSRPDRTGSRRPTLLDGMILVAATAVGLALAREETGWTLRHYLMPWRAIPLEWVGTAVYDLVLATLPLPAAWSAGLLLIRLIGPRPALRRLTVQPGAVALLAVGLALASRLAGLAVLTARVWLAGPSPGIQGSLWSIPRLSLAIVDSVHVSSGWARSLSVAVLVAWSLLALGGRWRPEPSWIDRAGRLLGAYWVAVVPISWFDFQFLD